MSGIHAILLAGSKPELPELPASLSAFADGSGGAVNARITFKRDGTIIDQDLVVIGNWTNKPSATVGDRFKVKYDHTSGSNLSSYPSGASDNVYCADISVDRTFTLTQAVVGTSTSGGTFTVANLAETLTDTATGSFSAERF